MTVPSQLTVIASKEEQKRQSLINMLMWCLPSGSKFPVNFNWEWRFSTEFLSLYIQGLLSLHPKRRTKQ